MGQLQDSPISPKARLLALDLLRLLAVVLVLGRHMPAPPESWPQMARLPYSIWIRGGWVGVDIFFVLSGFLVSGLLFNEYATHNRLEIGRFYTRRWWKIYPPLVVLIAVTVIFRSLQGTKTAPISLASELLFLQSYVPGIWNHTWSLAVEEHFYLLLPVILALILRWNRDSKTPLRPVLTVAAIVAAALLALRVLNWAVRLSYTHETHLFASHLRLDSLFFGVAISYVYHCHPDRFMRFFSPWRRALVVGGLLLLAPAFALPLEETPFIYTIGLSIFYVGSGMLLVGSLVSRIPRNRWITLLAGLGAFSYSVYLWHMPVLHWGVPLIELALGRPLGYIPYVAVYLCGSFFAGIVMAKVVEMPMLRLRDRWFPSRSAGAT